MPVDDLAAFEVLTTSEGPEGRNHAVQNATVNVAAPTWTEAVTALWRVPPPRLIVFDSSAGSPFTVVAGPSLVIAANPIDGAHRKELYRCRADGVHAPGPTAWGPASLELAAELPLGGDAAPSVVDVYVVAASDAAARAGQPIVSDPVNPAFRWLASNGDCTPRSLPQPEGHRRRWQITDASRAGMADNFSLELGGGGTRAVRASGRMTVRSLEPSSSVGGGSSLPRSVRCFRLTGRSPLTVNYPVGSTATTPMAYGWMFQASTEPVLRSSNFCVWVP